MKAALIVGLLGTCCTFLIGAKILHTSWLESLEAVVLSNLSGFVALWSVLSAQRAQTVFTRLLLKSPVRSWMMLSVLYFAPLLLLLPSLRTGLGIASWSFPLICATGLMLPLFGKAKDFFHGRQIPKKKR